MISNPGHATSSAVICRVQLALAHELRQSSPNGEVRGPDTTRHDRRHTDTAQAKAARQLQVVGGHGGEKGSGGLKSNQGDSGREGSWRRGLLAYWRCNMKSRIAPHSDRVGGQALTRKKIRTLRAETWERLLLRSDW